MMYTAVYDRGTWVHPISHIGPEPASEPVPYVLTAGRVLEIVGQRGHALAREPLHIHLLGSNSVVLSSTTGVVQLRGTPLPLA